MPDKPLHTIERSFELIQSISDEQARLDAIKQEANRFQLTISEYSRQFEAYQIAQTGQDNPRLFKPLSFVDAKVGDFVGWLENVSIIRLGTVLSEGAIIFALLSYLFSIPYLRQKEIDEARSLLFEQKDQPHSDGRNSALETLNSYCASNSGLQAEQAELEGIQLNRCHKFNLHNLKQWPPKFTKYEGIDLSQANLKQVNLANANLQGANLSGSDLSQANLAGVNLSGADLSGANLSGADLQQANLEGANLQKAVLSESLLNDAKLTKANLTHAKLINTQALWANFHSANLYHADLKGANLNRSDFRQSDLYKANLQGSSLRSVNLSNDANLRSTNLKDSDLSKSLFWSIPQLQRAKHWQTAKTSPNWQEQISPDVPPRLRIGLIKSSDSTIYSAYELGMRRAANRRIEVWSIQSKPGIDNEKNAIRELIQADIDAIVLSPEDPDGSIPAIQEAYRAGVVVITVDYCFDPEIAKNLVFACFNTNSFEMGITSGNHLVQWASENIPSQPLHIGVVDSSEYERYYPYYLGFKAAMNKSGVQWEEISSVNISVRGDIKAIQKMLNEHPKINILWGGANLATETAVLAVEALDKKSAIPIFGILDLSKDKARRLLDPTSPLQSIIDQAGVQIGNQALGAAIQVLRKHETDYKQYTIQHRLLTQKDRQTVFNLLSEADSIH